VDEYKTSSGVRLFEEQLKNAAAAISNDIAAHFHNAGFSE
jgi:hypothetical protein